MRLYRYWAKAEDRARDVKGRPVKFVKWAGSNDSQEDAQHAAKDAVKELLRRLPSMNIRDTNKIGHYYTTRGMPEELIGEPSDHAGITRNRYGALVLNAEEAVFVDVDLPMGNGFFANLFGKGQKSYLKRLDNWLERNPGSSARIYRTAAGMRYILTHTPQKVNDNTIEWLKELGSDSLYTTLCKVQECYRARLTPKPWRLKMDVPPNHYPRETAEEEHQFKEWLRDYEQKSHGYAVCKYLETRGETRIHPSLDRIVKDHDTATKADQDLPLA